MSAVASWNDYPVIAWLAQSPASTSTTISGKDLLVLVAPAATVIASLIGGLFLLRNLTKGPYDRLDVLIKARDSWPTELSGRSTVDRSIAFTLAQIRVFERDSRHHLPENEEELHAFRRAVLSVSIVRVLLSYPLCTLFAYALYQSGQPDTSHGWAIVFGVVAGCSALVGIPIVVDLLRLQKLLAAAMYARHQFRRHQDSEPTSITFDY
ncbi:hypothetical protein [Nocardia niigatensis]